MGPVKRQYFVYPLLLALVLMACSSAPGKQYEIRETWITMPDGVRLAADIYWPTGAGKTDRFPVLLEYLPYRKDESRARNYSLDWQDRRNSFQPRKSNFLYSQSTNSLKILHPHLSLSL